MDPIEKNRDRRSGGTVNKKRAHHPMVRNYPNGPCRPTGSGRNLLKWPEKFQPEQTHVSSSFLAEHLGCDWGRLVGHQARGRGGGCWNRQINDLVSSQNVRRSDAGTCGTDVQGLGELNELHTGSIGAAQENRDLQSYPGGSAALQLIQLWTFLETFRFHSVHPSTDELVRNKQLECQILNCLSE
jgi:hypothetical protein